MKSYFLDSIWKSTTWY